MIDKDVETLKTALDAAITALDDWTHIYAPEFCHEDRVAEACARIDRVGTIGYIADTVQQCREARKLLKMLQYKVEDRVRIVRTGHEKLDGQLATVKGYHLTFMIVLFDNVIPGYEPAMVLTPACLEKVENEAS